MPVVIPVAGFLLFAFTGRRGRGKPADGRYPVTSTLVAAHLIALLLGYSGLILSRAAAVVDVHERKPAAHYGQEWRSQGRLNRQPNLCLAMSGGGIRSAAFNIGVLWALHEQHVLPRLDVISSVSGGSYAMSWFLLQQFYGLRISGMERQEFLDRMFRPQEAPQRHLAAHARQFESLDTPSYYALAALGVAEDVLPFNSLRALTWVAGNENLMNASSSRIAYRESLQRTFQMVQHPGTGGFVNEYRSSVTEYAAHANLSVVTKVSFRQLADFARKNQLPFFVFNTTLDVAADREGQGSPIDALWPVVFELSGWGLGSDSYGYRSWDSIDETDLRFQAARLVNVAPAISGAAVSPVAIAPGSGLRTLLWVTNADLGYLLPRFNDGGRGSLYLSDGGHSENLGVYSLVRRGCRNIIVVDAEHEPREPYAFAGYQHVRDLLRHEMDLEFYIPQPAFQHVDPVLAGTIERAGAPGAHGSERVVARVAYIKLAMDKARRSAYPSPLNGSALGDAFPQDPTANQNFGPLQYEAYRDLGHWIATRSKVLAEFETALDEGS